MSKLKDKKEDFWEHWIQKKYLPEDMLKNVMGFWKKLLNLHKVKTKKCLEIGSGHGIRTEILNGIFSYITCVDPLQSLIEALKSRNYKNVASTHVMKGEKFKNDIKYDMVCFTFVLPFMDQKKAMSMAYRQLKSGGHLLVMEPLHLARKVSGKTKDAMMENMRLLNTTRKFSMISMGLIGKSSGLYYLLKKI